MKSDHPLMLIVSHSIYLTKTDRYRLIRGEDVEVIGVSIPVWHYKGDTSEPAQEVFCKYKLSNSPEKRDQPIASGPEGYEMNLPQYPEGWKPPLPISDEGWRRNLLAKAHHENELKNWPKTAENLRDIRDGGSEFLHWTEHNKIQERGHMCSIAHVINVKTTEELERSLSD